MFGTYGSRVRENNWEIERIRKDNTLKTFEATTITASQRVEGRCLIENKDVPF